MAGTSTLEIVSEKIPHSWFDVIGRIVPGAFLLAGILEILLKPIFMITCTRLLNQTATVLTTVTVVGLTLYIAAAYVTGFLLAPLSFLVIEWTTDLLWPIKDECIPTSVKDLAQAILGEVDARRIRDFCGNFIWTHPEAAQIAIITSKRDAETLASRSLAVAGLGLAVANAIHGYWCHVFVLILIAGAGCLSFRHYRRRSFDARFDATAALLWRANKSAAS